MGRAIFLQLAHPKYQDSILIEAYPEPCESLELTCRWSRDDLPDLDIQRYRFLHLILDDGRSAIIVPVTPRVINSDGFTVELSEEARIAGKRKVRRYSCRNIKATFSQGSFLAKGALLDFSPLGFRIKVRPGRHCSFHDLDSDGLFFLHLEREGQTHFSQPCRVVRQGREMAEREIVLAPATAWVNRFKKREIRSPRHCLKPGPVLVFKHPFFQKTVRLDLFDLSFSGLSVHEQSDSGVLLPGLILPEMRIELTGTEGINCVGQVVYRLERLEGLVRCGIAILDMDFPDYSRLADMLIRFINSGTHISADPDMDELWGFFFRSGAIQPETYPFIAPHKKELKEALSRVRLGSPEIGKHVVYEKNGQIICYASLVRSYDRAWLISQHLCPGEDEEAAGLKLLNQLMAYLYDMHRLPSAQAGFAVRCFQTGDRFSERIYEDFAMTVGSPKVCSIDHFSSMTFKKGGAENALPEPWSLEGCSQIDLWELNRFYEHSSGGLLMDLLSLAPDGRGNNALGPTPRQFSLVTDMKTYALRHEGELCAVIIATQAEPGFQVFELANCLKIIVAAPSRLPRVILFKAIAQVSNYYEHLDRINVMVYPHDYLTENGIPSEKQYKFWILNLSFMERYLEHLDKLRVRRKDQALSRNGGRYAVEGHSVNGTDMRLVGDLAAGMAHSFNNLLMGIQGHASLLLMDTDPSDPRHKHLAAIEHCVKDASTLTRQLLGFAGGGKYHLRPTDLNTLIERSVWIFKKDVQHLRIHTRYGRDIWTVDADQDQITDALLSLYKNAWEAMPRGGDLYLETENTHIDKSSDLPPGLPAGNYVKISVRDTGVGMDRDTRERCFAPFFTTKGLGNALGMGLAAAYGVVRNHRGFMKVESMVGEGSTFTLYLPSSDTRA